MHDRTILILKIACGFLTVLIVLQAFKLLADNNPLKDVQLPSSSVQDPSVTGESTDTHAEPRPGTKPQLDIPAALQACIDHLDQSGVLGRTPKPVPFQLFGFAGNAAFIRVPSGQTGWVAEGEELGGVKVLRIGTNRVLLEHEGKQLELTLFSGMGSDSLMNELNK